MRCEAVHEHLKALLDGELGLLQAGQVRRHLTRCPACAAEYAMIGRLNTMLLPERRSDRRDRKGATDETHSR
jgi:anti-sigma factor RsiW